MFDIYRTTALTQLGISIGSKNMRSIQRFVLQGYAPPGYAPPRVCNPLHGYAPPPGYALPYGYASPMISNPMHPPRVFTPRKTNYNKVHSVLIFQSYFDILIF